MSETYVKMDMFGGALQIGVRLWSKAQRKYRWTYLTLDTGASVTVVSPEILYQLGYDPLSDKATMTTASGVERVRRFKLEKMVIGDIEIDDVEVYAHKFPEECFSIGVVGLNVLRLFDIELLFSKGIIKLKRLMPNAVGSSGENP